MPGVYCARRNSVLFDDMNHVLCEHQLDKNTIHVVRFAGTRDPFRLVFSFSNFQDRILFVLTEARTIYRIPIRNLPELLTVDSIQDEIQGLTLAFRHYLGTIHAISPEHVLLSDGNHVILFHCDTASVNKRFVLNTPVGSIRKVLVLQDLLLAEVCSYTSSYTYFGQPFYDQGIASLNTITLVENFHCFSQYGASEYYHLGPPLDDERFIVYSRTDCFVCDAKDLSVVTRFPSWYSSVVSFKYLTFVVPDTWSSFKYVTCPMDHCTFDIVHIDVYERPFLADMVTRACMEYLCNDVIGMIVDFVGFVQRTRHKRS